MLVATSASPTIGTATGTATATITKHHHGHFNRFYAYPYFYGGYYAYNDYGYGSCNWLYRRAVTTNSSYCWNRYYACAG